MIFCLILHFDCLIVWPVEVLQMTSDYVERNLIIPLKYQSVDL